MSSSAARSTMRTVAIIVGVIALLIGAWFLATQFQRGTADYRGDTDLIEDTQANADFRRTAYESFFDKCAAVQTTEARILALQAEAETASEARAEEIAATITANQAQRARLINEYNADAAKDWTSGQFQASNLPYRLDANQETTTCAL